jgi:uncharacterized membrane protein YccC
MSTVKEQRDRLTELTNKASDKYIRGDMHGIHYAVSIFIATAILWVCVHMLAEKNPIWAISSMVATSDPLMKNALTFFKARITNALVGCLVGLAFIAIGGSRLLMLPLAMAVTVLLSTYVVRITTMWRQAPITAAFVISAGIEYHSRLHGLQAGVTRMAEVLFGCVVGLAVAWMVSVLWPLPDPEVKGTA